MIPKKQYLIFSHIMFEFILLNSCIIAVLLLKNPEATFLISDRIIDNVSIQLVMIYNIVWSAIVYFNGDKGFYTSQSVRKRFEFLTINIFLFIGMISTVAILFQVEIFNRTTFLLPIFVFSFLNFFLFSLLFEYYKMRNENPFNSNVLMIGADSRKFELEDFGKRIKSKGYQIEGYLIDNLSKNNNNRVARIDVLGELKDLSQVLENKSVDEIFIATAALRSKKIRSVISNADYHGVRVNLVPETPLFPSKLLKTYDLEGLPIFQHRQTPLMYLKKALLKRSFDIVFSILVLVLLSPVFLLTALMIWLDGGFNKSIFYKPHRKGEADESFKCFKFRTMYLNKESDYSWTKVNDPRVTRFGVFLRRTSLDEFPQFLNVFLGQMSIVGPRPHPIKLNDLYRDRIEKFHLRHKTRPGITGLAQMKGYRGSISKIHQINSRVKLDRFYIQKWTFLFDLKIILLTIPATIHWGLSSK